EGEPLLLGFVVPRQNGDAHLLDGVRCHLEATLPGHMRPRRLLVLDALPVLPGQKVDEAALLARVGARGLPGLAQSSRWSTASAA
ncbi:hypothetical protein RMT89_44260, partial [Streptomyces sp. P17]|nr:hypothetical protein [Streptomyces sp. P17]